MAFWKNKEQGKAVEKSTQTVPSNGGWWGWLVKEAFTGAWQKNIEWRREDVLAYHAVFSCISLIASDISKLRPRIVRDANGIWTEVPLAKKYSVIENPNSYQNRMQFYESWVNSKLIRGNAYILKVRDDPSDRKRVTAMHVLHPDRVLPLVTDDGDVFYQLGADNLSGVTTLGVTVPASEIIHDRFNCFYHPLVGLSPLYASGLPAYMGLQMLENSSRMFKNGGKPSGILTVPEAIKKADADIIANAWEEKYGGNNAGKVAVLGGNVKFEPISITAEEWQMVEQLKLSAEMVCSTFHVPAYKVIGNAPAYNNIEALEQSYYSQCLQNPIEAIELCLDKNLPIEETFGMEFDLDGLLRMDTKTQMETYGMGTTKGIVAPNEARRKLNLAPVTGGETPYLQEQNYPLASLALRPAPIKSETSAAPAVDPDPTDDSAKSFFDTFVKGFDNELGMEA